MIGSMTGFAQKKGEYPWGTLCWEIRSVNHRYLDMRIKLPEKWSGLETPIRQALKKRLSRGKIDVVLKFHAQQQENSGLCLDQQLICQLQSLCTEISKKIPQSTTDISRLLHWPGVIKDNDIDTETWFTQAQSLFDECLTLFIESRHNEGQALQGFLHEQMNTLLAHTQEFAQRAPEYIEQHQLQLRDSLQKLDTPFDSQRLEQELLLIGQKWDITEEWQRLETHLATAQANLQKGGIQGKRLDFLVQEMHRETNTMINKTHNTKLIQLGLECKVLIEQMREQIQNIE